jgi:hypothetical protein
VTRHLSTKTLGGVTLVALFWSVSLPTEPKYGLCAFRWLTGRPCPLCGMTRALFALAKGHWSQAVHLHALSPLGLVMLGSLFWKNESWRDWLWRLGLPAFAAYGVWRAVFTGS